MNRFLEKIALSLPKSSGAISSGQKSLSKAVKNLRELREKRKMSLKPNKYLEKVAGIGDVGKALIRNKLAPALSKMTAGVASKTEAISRAAAKPSGIKGGIFSSSELGAHKAKMEALGPKLMNGMSGNEANRVLAVGARARRMGVIKEATLLNSAVSKIGGGLKTLGTRTLRLGKSAIGDLKQVATNTTTRGSDLRQMFPTAGVNAGPTPSARGLGLNRLKKNPVALGAGIAGVVGISAMSRGNEKQAGLKEFAARASGHRGKILYKAYQDTKPSKHSIEAIGAETERKQGFHAGAHYQTHELLRKATQEETNTIAARKKLKAVAGYGGAVTGGGAVGTAVSKYRQNKDKK